MLRRSKAFCSTSDLMYVTLEELAVIWMSVAVTFSCTVSRSRKQSMRVSSVATETPSKNTCRFCRKERNDETVFFFLVCLSLWHTGTIKLRQFECTHGIFSMHDNSHWQGDCVFMDKGEEDTCAAWWTYSHLYIHSPAVRITCWHMHRFLLCQKQKVYLNITATLEWDGIQCIYVLDL